MGITNNPDIEYLFKQTIEKAHCPLHPQAIFRFEHAAKITHSMSLACVIERECTHSIHLLTLNKTIHPNGWPPLNHRPYLLFGQRMRGVLETFTCSINWH